MKRIIGLVTFLLLISGLAACGSSSQSESKSSSDMANEEMSASEQRAVEPINSENDGVKNNTGENLKQSRSEEQIFQETENENRMVIYNADLRIEVNDFRTVQDDIENLVRDMRGYIVQSNVYNQGNNQLSGSVTLRIPQTNFDEFLNQVESLSIKVHNRDVRGQDVTEEYVDLESRLKSKQVVEERLLQFLKDAKETKDLLQISDDLANIQEELEQIKGRMKYLENQTSLSTVTISIFENKVIVPDFEKDDLNTVEKTKQQFMTSLNALLGFASGVVVFLIGNSPIIFLLGVLIIIIMIVIKRYRNQNDRN